MSYSYLLQRKLAHPTTFHASEMASLRSDTEFLDLAPEIVDRILAAYVDKAGVVEAWKNRRVCRKYNYIHRRFVMMELTSH